MQEQKTSEQPEEQGIKLEDAKLAIEIFKKTLEYRPFIKKAILGQEFLALSQEDRLNEMLTPRIGLQYVDEDGKIPCLFFRFVGDESPVVEAIFYPFEAVLSFLAEARSYIQWLNLAERTDEEKEQMAINHATTMTFIMIDNFYRRAELMMDSFISEVIAQWRIQNRQNIIQYHAERGNILEKKKDLALENLLKFYTKDVLQLWKYQGQSQKNLRKLSLAEEYDGIYRHWKRLSKMLSDEDWRVYAKVEKFQDTPDDLLDKLDNADRFDDTAVEHRLSELAIEHAARHVGLIKKHGVGESVITQRQKGVRVTGYTSAQLFNFLKEGRELVERLKTAQEALAQENAPAPLEQGSDSAQMKKVKSFEQKIKFIKANNEGAVKQNGDLAQKEKS